MDWLEIPPPWPQHGPSNDVEIGSEKWVTGWVVVVAVEHRNAAELTKLPVCCKMPVQIPCRPCIYVNKFKDDFTIFS